jgi:hypothetical protein
MGGRRGATRATVGVAALALTLMGVAGCGGDDSASTAATVEVGRSGESADTGATSDAEEGRAIDRDVTIYVTVDDVGETSTMTLRAIADAGGVVDASDISLQPEEFATARIAARVPPDQLEAIVDQVAGLGDLTSRQQTAADVTTQVTDLELRIASARASVTRVQALLDSAKELKDVVLLEGELTKRQTELEQLEAQQQELAKQTETAGLVVQLSRTPMSPPSPNDTGIGDALSAGWDGFITVLHLGVVVLAFVLPFLVAGALIVLVVVVIRRRVRRNRSDAPPSPPAPAPGP